MVNVIGIPFDANSSYLRGTAKGPAAIRAALHSGSGNYFTQEGFDINRAGVWQDRGDLVFESEDPIGAHNHIFESISRLLEDGNPLISLGGDHSITYPVMKAFAGKYSEIHLLQFDAHGDLYHDFEGNPYSHASPFARIMEAGLAASLTQIGIRTLTVHQREQATKYGVRIVEMKDFDWGFLEGMQGPLYISFDMDSLDPAFAPGVSHHEPGGFSTREVLKTIKRIHLPIIGADIVELNPDRDVNQMTATLGAKLLKEFIGKL